LVQILKENKGFSAGCFIYFIYGLLILKLTFQQQPFGFNPAFGFSFPTLPAVKKCVVIWPLENCRMAGLFLFVEK
jgi:hypothetical protein